MNDLIVHTDGGARGNPGPAAVGVYITDVLLTEVASFARKIGETTNNVAEYQAVLEALLWIKNNLKDKPKNIIFFLDSNLVVNQLNGVFKIKESHLAAFVYKIKTLEKEVAEKVSYSYVPREKNKVADSLVNKALDGFIN
ncbi:MAG: ribonuclease HI family protein [Patescibacteria group bacterium]|jgi:ribonuclease HI